MMKNILAMRDVQGPSRIVEHPGWPALLREIRDRAPEFEAQGFVSHDIIASLKRIGVYRAAVLKRFGGDEREPVEILEMIESLSAADGSVGWVASFAPQASVYCAILPDQCLREMYANGPDIVAAGALYPAQAAKQVGDNLLVNGRWSFASGCTSADWICVGITVEGSPIVGVQMVMLPAAKVEIVRNWDVVGLRATGSNDIVARDVLVSRNWAAQRGGPVQYADALYQFPALCFAALNHACVNLGIARSAIEDMVELAKGKASITGAPRPADRVHVQLGLAKADAKLRSARAFFFEQTEVMWQIVKAGNVPATEEKSLVRLAAINAARIGAEVVQEMFTLAGTTATRMANPMQRRLRDSMMVTQHAFVTEGHLENVGRVMLGLQSAPGFP
jgi:indole-3-acetate monooxygenase